MHLKAYILILAFALAACASVSSIPYVVASCKVGQVCAVSMHPTRWPWDSPQVALIDCQKRPCVVFPQTATATNPLSMIQSASGLVPTIPVPTGF